MIPRLQILDKLGAAKARQKEQKENKRKRKKKEVQGRKLEQREEK